MNKALGLIEVYGYLTAVQAADSALKAAQVNLFGLEKIKGGLVTILLTGDVDAVQAASNAAKAAAKQVGKIHSVHVIPRPANGVMTMLRPPKPPLIAAPPPAMPTISPAQRTTSPLKSSVDVQSMSEDELAKLKVVQLRSAARRMKLDNITPKQIKFAKREELLSKIRDFRSRRDD
ncbi:MAG: BMC domain-containing protein [Oscillospiraceae bacterium]